ncbi:hypothetical protein [Streptomyces sp. 8N706]
MTTVILSGPGVRNAVDGQPAPAEGVNDVARFTAGAGRYGDFTGL